MNQLVIIGNLVRDPETGTTEGGINWCRFTVAARKKRVKEGEADAEFVRVTAWRGLGDTCAKYLKKGRKVCVIGEPKVHAWIGQKGDARGEMEMNADEVEFVDSSSGSGGKPTDADAPPAPRSGAPAETVDPETGEILPAAQAAPAPKPAEQQMTLTDAQTGFTQVEEDDQPF